MYTCVSLSCVWCFKFLFLSFLHYNLIAIYITMKVSCSNLAIKTQYKLYLTVHWYLCHTWTSYLSGSYLSPQKLRESLCLNSTLLAAFATVCLTDLIIPSSSVLKTRVILVQVIKRRHCAENRLIKAHFEPKPSEMICQILFSAEWGLVTQFVLSGTSLYLNWS